MLTQAIFDITHLMVRIHHIPDPFFEKSALRLSRRNTARQPLPGVGVQTELHRHL